MVDFTQHPLITGRYTRMNPNLAVHELAADHVVLEFHERITAPGLALELHIVRDSEGGGTIAWWEDDRGKCLGIVDVAEA